MNMGSMGWKPLPAFANCPPLLVRPNISSQSYSLHVTDLANTWVESLDRKGIGKRSLNEDTSIDPTEGPDQMAMLLTKIQAALDPSAPEHHQTSTGLAVSPQGEECGLALSITCHLPDGLKPLKWTFQLTKCPVASIATELVVPLIQAQHYRAREITELISSLRKKDHVIGKLVDKLESVGVGLDNVFNALSGKRKPSRELAGEKIKGLAPFEESGWRTTTQLPSAETPNNITSLVDDVFSHLLYHEDMETDASHNLDDWWRKPGIITIAGDRREQKKQDTAPLNATQGDLQPEESRLAADEDDGFQVQATPPQADRSRRGRTVVDLDDTTDDEAEAIPDSHPTPAQQASSRLGAIGKRGSAEPSSAGKSSRHTVTAEDDTASEAGDEPIQSPPSHKKAGRLGGIGKRSGPVKGETKPPPAELHVSQGDNDAVTESENDGPVKSLSPSPSSDQQAPKRKLGAIGRIGGNTRQTSIQPESGSKSPDAVPAKPSGRKIGAIGKRKAEDKRLDSQAASQNLEEIETDEQRAERKRVELVKELERKAAAKPAKKKRKF